MDSVRRLRKERGWTQRDLAAKAGTTQYTISEIELGHRDPHPTTLRKLAQALDISGATSRLSQP
jgi:transcriptional regulator with XRE-family HTH domain